MFSDVKNLQRREFKINVKIFKMTHVRFENKYSDII